jgi:hypothetical protein
MRKSYAWKKDWMRKCSLGPYVFQNRVEKRLRREIHLANFSFEMNEQLISLEQSLPETTIRWLYEACLLARSEKATVAMAYRIFGNKSWKRGERQRNKLRTLLKGFVDYDADSKLRKTLNLSLPISLTWITSGLPTTRPERGLFVPRTPFRDIFPGAKELLPRGATYRCVRLLYETLRRKRILY